jgi:GTP-binding protein
MTAQHPMLTLLRQAAFLTSAPRLSACPPTIAFEVAFAGRSNAGKSSAINTLTNQRQLARASKTPGRTQLLNYFSLDEQRCLVDLPGYGYAAVPLAVKEAWQKELENYLIKRDSLQGLIVLMDIRHPLQKYDEMLLNWAQRRNLRVHILLTKADKLNRSPALAALQSMQKQLKAKNIVATVQLFSALRRMGLEEAAQVLGEWLNYPPAPVELVAEDVTTPAIDNELTSEPKDI